MTELKPCATCHRHLQSDSASCPFCGATVVTGGAAGRALRRGRLSRAAVFAGAALAAGACGGKARPPELPPEDHQHAGGGGCSDPDPAEIARLEKERDEAQTEDAKQAIERRLEEARMPVCMPYGAPPRRRRVV